MNTKNTNKSFFSPARLNGLLFNAQCPSCLKRLCIYPHILKYIVFLLIFLHQYISVLATKVNAVQTSEMVLQCFDGPQKKQRSFPQKCAFACNCWFAFPYSTSFVVSVEHTPMWSSLLCLSMIRQYVTAVMICSLTVSAASPLRLLSRLRQMLPGSPCWETDEACDSTGLCKSVCVCYRMRGTMVIWWRKRGYRYILRWKVSLPSCACVYVCVCGRVCVWTRGCGHAALADGITALPGHPG